MTAFEKSLRALDEEALRVGAEELLTLLAGADGVRRGDPGSGGGQKQRGAAAALISAFAAAGASPEKGGGERPAASAVDGPAPNGAIPEAARVRRDDPETDGTGPAADFPGGESDGEIRKDRENRGARKQRNSREDRENGEAPEDWESREKPAERKDGEERTRTLYAQDREAAGRAETQALENRLKSVSRQRRSSLRQSGGDGESGVYTTMLRGPERRYEGAVGARGMEMHRISDYFRRDSRRYDTGFTKY